MICKIVGSSRISCMSAVRKVSVCTAGVVVIVFTGSRGGDRVAESRREVSEELDDAIVLVGV